MQSVTPHCTTQTDVPKKQLMFVRRKNLRCTYIHTLACLGLRKLVGEANGAWRRFRSSEAPPRSPMDANARRPGH